MGIIYKTRGEDICLYSRLLAQQQTHIFNARKGRRRQKGEIL
jgi:hypothetical protein